MSTEGKLIYYFKKTTEEHENLCFTPRFAPYEWQSHGARSMYRLFKCRMPHRLQAGSWAHSFPVHRLGLWMMNFELMSVCFDVGLSALVKFLFSSSRCVSVAWVSSCGIWWHKKTLRVTLWLLCNFNSTRLLFSDGFTSCVTSLLMGFNRAVNSVGGLWGPVDT